MSTKTTFKRVALVAVASLGFGMLSVVPSSATAGDAATNASISSITVTNPTTPSVGAAAAFSIAVKNATQIAAGTADTYAVRAKITSAPAGGLSAFTGAFVTVTGWSNGAGAVGNSGANLLSATWSTGNLAANTTTAIGTLTFTPAVAGTYAVNFYHDANLDGIQQDNEVFQTASIAVGATASSSELANSADTTASVDASTTAGLKVSSVGIETVQVSGRTGIQIGFAPQYRITRNAGATAADSVAVTSRNATIAYSVTNPAGTAVTVVSAQGGATASTSQAIAGVGSIAMPTPTAAVTQAISPTTGWPQKGSVVYFSAATAGTYTITAFHDANRDTLVSVGEATTTSTVVVAADALPSITMTTYGQTVGGSTDAANGGIGHLVKISLKNGTTPASLGLSEVLTVSGPTGTVIDRLSKRDANYKLALVDNTTANGGFTSADSTTVLLTQANFDAAGNAYINVGNSTAGGGTYALTATISGGTGAGATGSGSFTALDEALYVPTTNPDKATSFTNLTGVAGTGRAADAGAANYDFTVKAGTATNVAIGYKPGASATADAYNALITDTYGLITGLIGAQYDLYKTVGTTATTADSVISWTVPVPAIPATTTGVAVTLTVSQTDTSASAAVSSVFRISQALAAATTSYSNPALDAASHTYRAAVASSNKMTVEVVDQFGNALPNISVNAAVAGRNSTTVIPTMLTDANGLVSYTLVDSSTSTTLLTDTVTFTPATGATASVTINYATYLPVSTITMTTPDSANATATGIAGAIKTDISSADGAEAGAVDVSVVLKDANGATLPAGIAVSFAVSGNAGAAILSTHKTLYTDASGKATTKVYAWLNGNATVTATAGAVSATGIVYFVQGSEGAEARTITAKADGNVVTAKVTDRFGNAIKGVTVTATRVGSGTFNGTSSITGVTDAAGSVDFVLTNGTADVTVSLPLTGNYSLATKGYTNAGITALTAYTAGTVSIAEEGVGASFDAAGVNSATVNVSDSSVQSAADAAAEATDAANAATDAANAAAEAADAATAAAQDAADAVAALSTQVSEMVNALKKQITALTNLVIKIQKKVRA